MSDLTVSSTVDTLLSATTQAGARAAIGAGAGDAVTSGALAQFAATTSAQLRGVLSDETGTGAAVFANSPAFVTPTGIVKGDVGLGNLDNTSDANKPVSTAGQAALDLKSNLSLTINTQTASYTLVLTDNGKYVRMNSGSALNLTVPPNASVAFPTGSQIVIRNTGAGQVAVVAGAAVTINTSQTLLLRAQHSSATLVKVGTNEWDLAGDLEAA